MTAYLEVVVGTYEEIVLGFMLSQNDEGYQFEPSFTDHSHISSVRCAAVSDRHVLATGGADEHIKLLNLKSRKELGSLMQHEGTVTNVCFWGRRHLFSGSEDHTVCLYDTKTWELLRTFKGHQGGVTGLTVHPSGKFMMSVSKDKHLRTWDLVRGRPAFTSNIKAVAEAIRFNRAGNKYLVQYQDKVDVYSLETASVVYSLAPAFRVLTNDVTADHILLGGEGGNIAVYSMEDGRHLCTQQLHDERLKAVVAHRMGEEDWVVTTCSGGQIRVWVLEEEGSHLKQLSATSTHFRPVCLAVRDCRQKQVNQSTKKLQSPAMDEKKSPLKEDFDKATLNKRKRKRRAPSIEVSETSEKQATSKCVTKVEKKADVAKRQRSPKRLKDSSFDQKMQKQSPSPRNEKKRRLRKAKKRKSSAAV